MKQILYGNSMILMGLFGLLVSWIGDIRAIDIIGVVFAIIGFCLATYGFFSKN